METKKKNPLGWLASGSSEAGRTVVDWVKEPESKKEMLGRVGGVLMGGVVAVAAISDMGFSGVLLDAGAVVGTAAWFHFSPKAKGRKEQRPAAPETVPVASAPPAEGTEGPARPEQPPSNDWTEGRPEVGQPATCADASGDLEDEPTVRLDSGDLSRQSVQSVHDGAGSGPEGGVHAGQGPVPEDAEERPEVGQGTNVDHSGESVSGRWTDDPQSTDLPRPEAVQGLDSADPDWFIRYIQAKEEIELPEVAPAPVPVDPFDASLMVKEQPPLWSEEDADAEPAQEDDPVSGEPSSYQESREQQARELERRQDVMLDEQLLNAMSVRQIADKYQMSPSTVGDWIGKARKRRKAEVTGFRWGAETPGNTTEDGS